MTLLRRFPRLLGLLAGQRERTVIKRIRRASVRLDAFDAIANFSLSVTPLNDQPDGTGETDQIMAIPEFAALIFAERSRKRITDQSRKARALSTMHSLIPGALFAANMRTMFSLIRASDTANEPGHVVPRLTHAAISREVFLRLPRFHDKETQLLKELFTGEVRHSLVEKLGFGAEEMFAVYEALNSFVAQSAFDTIRGAATDLHERVAESPELLAFLENRPGGIEEAKKHIATVQGFSDFGSAISLTFEQLKKRTNLAHEPLRALLDAWYFYERSQRTTFAPKPTQPLTPDMIETLDMLNTHRPRGWLQASLNLLEMDLPQRAQRSGAPRDLRATTRKDRRLHSMYVEVNAPDGERFGFVAMSFKAGTPKGLYGGAVPPVRDTPPVRIALRAGIRFRCLAGKPISVRYFPAPRW
jgi:hypothetical protein